MVASRARHESGQPLGRDLRGEILVVVEFVEHQGETDAELDDHDGDQDEEEVSNHVGGERIVEAGRFGHALPIAVGVHVLGPLGTRRTVRLRRNASHDADVAPVGSVSFQAAVRRLDQACGGIGEGLDLSRLDRDFPLLMGTVSRFRGKSSHPRTHQAVGAMVV